MIDLLKLWARRVVPVTAALALVVGFAGFAQAHDDEDDDEDRPPVQYYHDWHAGPHVGPHGGCHWGPDYGYHCGPHVGVHSGEHHNWYTAPRYDYGAPYYGAPRYYRAPYYGAPRYYYGAPY
jgi:hypothetical protein